MLLTLTVGGNALFTDSAQNGIYGYQPFTDAQGVWECLGEADGSGKVCVMLLDFTSSTAREPEAKIARMDFEAHYNMESGEITGDAILRLAPLTVDPYDVENFNAPRDYSFSGLRLGFSDKIHVAAWLLRRRYWSLVRWETRDDENFQACRCSVRFGDGDQRRDRSG